MAEVHGRDGVHGKRITFQEGVCGRGCSFLPAACQNGECAWWGAFMVGYAWQGSMHGMHAPNLPDTTKYGK